ncbi:MAG: MBL fold metallo-hydrolase [Gammaproteobacteria bacterium]|nr:MBL fold metallo-hydrolase [Gammaproteobacteria bacterium]
MELHFFGAAGEVTGSCHLIKLGQYQILLDCGLIQGSRVNEARNEQPFPFNPKEIDAVILSHAHIDHSGRLPLLVKRGFSGPIYAQQATKVLCRVMLKDAAFLNEKDAEWENKKRERKGLSPVVALYDRTDAIATMRQFRAKPYGEIISVLPGIRFRFQDAGHILGSSIIELWLDRNSLSRKIVFSGDLGQDGMPILRDPASIESADLVLMESTYGNRMHRSFDATLEELREIFTASNHSRGNIIIPSFAVGRTQQLLYLFSKYAKDWNIAKWHIFLDSPMAIEATEVHDRFTDLYDSEAARLWRDNGLYRSLPNLHFSRTTNQSMAINRISAGAIIIAGSGMCTGGRIKHHLKNNIWRKKCQVIIPGFQAAGTIGRALVDGARHIRLWGETIKVSAKIHTIGGLSAHADQRELLRWLGGFKNRPPVVLVHGESEALQTLAAEIRSTVKSNVHIADYGMSINLGSI